MKTFVRITVLFHLILSVFGNSVYAQPIDGGLLKRMLETHIENDHAVGIAVGYIDDGQTETLMLGKFEANNTISIDESSIFEIASITKTFTGLLLADMVVRGEVELDDPVSIYLPEGVVVPAFNSQQITLKHLATHTAALPGWPSNLKPKDDRNHWADYSVDDMYDFLSEYEMESAPGRRVQYTNISPGLLGHALSLKAGMSFEELLHERIFLPLGMSSTAFKLSVSQQEQFTTGHDVAGVPTIHTDYGAMAGAAGLKSTIGDMMKYLSANMGLTETPLTEAIKLSHQMQVSTGARDEYVGLGWFTTPFAGKMITNHSGGSTGYSSYIGMDKEGNRGAVVLINAHVNSDDIGRAILTDQIHRLKIDKSEPPENRDQIVGDYKNNDGYFTTISEAKGHFFYQEKDSRKHPLFFDSHNKFFFDDFETAIEFNEDEGGSITSMTIEVFNGLHAIKVVE